MTQSLLEHVLVPVAHENDAAASARALAPYLPDRVTVCHVVEKAGGAPDKTPVEQSEAIAEASFARFREVFSDAETFIQYDTDVVNGILAVAGDVNATAIAFRPRDGGRVSRFLSGDIALRLVTDADRPVIALPAEPDSEEE